MESKGTIVMDLDGTICTQKSTGTYHEAEPIMDVIRQVNALWTDGWEIVIHTARGMRTCNGHVELVEEKYRKMTEKWLADNRVCYSKLVFGKPAADYYVDDKCLHPQEFVDWER